MKHMVTFMLFLVSVGAAEPHPAQDAQPRIGKPSGSFFAILVPSAEESARWYHEKLGFAVVRDAENPDRGSRTVMLEQSGVLIEIIQVRGSYALRQVTDKKPDALEGIRKIGIVVEGGTFDELSRHLMAQKVEFVGGVFEDEGLHLRSFIVRDSDGNLVQFFTSAKP